MKKNNSISKLLAITALAAVSTSGLACDESCQRESAMAEHQVDFPSYLTWDFCGTTKQSFLESDLRRLKNYRNERFDVSRHGSMYNIKKFLDKREEWLAECDEYLRLTGKGPVFGNESNTQEVFDLIERVSRNLDRVARQEIEVSQEDGEEIIGARFDRLFSLLDDHRAIMLREGQFVTQ